MLTSQTRPWLTHNRPKRFLIGCRRQGGASGKEIGPPSRQSVGGTDPGGRRGPSSALCSGPPGEEHPRSGRASHPEGRPGGPRPWALDPELEEAVRERDVHAAPIVPIPCFQRQVDRSEEGSSEIEQRITRDRFRAFVTTTLNKPASLGRVSKL